MSQLPKHLNIGCGTDIRERWCNIDLKWMPGMVEGRDFAMDIMKGRWTWDDARLANGNVFKHIEASHVIEHVDNRLLFMSQLWHLAQPDATLLIKTPHGGSDEAWQDPTHVAPIFEGSFQYFDSQVYWMQHPDYAADWELEQVTLFTEGLDIDALGHEKAYKMVQHGRNFVKEMHAVLVAHKPARPWPDKPQKIVLNIELRNV